MKTLLAWERSTANCYTARLYDWIGVTVRRRNSRQVWRIEMSGDYFHDRYRTEFDDLDDAKKAAELWLAYDVREAYRILSIGRALEAS